MYQRHGEIFDNIIWDYSNHVWIIDGNDVTESVIQDAYRKFLQTPGQIETVLDIWNGADSSYYIDARRLIFALAIKQPGIHPMIVALYLLALKHKCLHMFQCTEGLSEYAIEDLLPYDVRLIFIDVKQMISFYNQYGTHHKPSKNFNKIKVPSNFPKP